MDIYNTSQAVAQEWFEPAQSETGTGDSFSFFRSVYDSSANFRLLEANVSPRLTGNHLPHLTLEVSIPPLRRASCCLTEHEQPTGLPYSYKPVLFKIVWLLSYGITRVHRTWLGLQVTRDYWSGKRRYHVSVTKREFEFHQALRTAFHLLCWLVTAHAAVMGIWCILSIRGRNSNSFNIMGWLNIKGIWIPPSRVRATSRLICHQPGFTGPLTNYLRPSLNCLLLLR